jgi:hypothetical protein
MPGLRQYLLPYVASNLIALALLFIAWRWSRIAQRLCALVFFWASMTNATTAVSRPQAYLGYAALTPSAVPLLSDLQRGDRRDGSSSSGRRHRYATRIAGAFP